MKNVLVTAVGGDIGQSVVRCLREIGSDIVLMGADIHDRHGGGLFVDKFFTLPPAENPEYLESLTNIVNSQNIDVTIPINEIELRVLANAAANVELLHCGRNVVNIGLDKLKTMEFLERSGIAIPWTVNADTADPNEIPCFLKPRFGSGSRSIFTVNSVREAKFFSDRYPGCVFQELLEPHESEITCAVYRAKDGRIASIQFERLLTGGLTGWAKVVENKSVKYLLHNIAIALELCGSINIQLRITDKGPMIFEINPRFSSTAYMRHKLGFSDVVWSVKEFFGEAFKLREAKPGLTVVRTHDVAVIEA